MYKNKKTKTKEQCIKQKTKVTTVNKKIICCRKKEHKCIKTNKSNDSKQTLLEKEVLFIVDQAANISWRTTVRPPPSPLPSSQSKSFTADASRADW